MALWLLLKSSDATGSSIPLLPKRLSFGPPQYQFDVDLTPDNDDDLYRSAQNGGQQGFKLLWREGYIRQSVTARFAFTDDVSNVYGSSADLLFALATITQIMPGNQYPPLAATGSLDEQGWVQAVEGVPAKLRSILEVMPEGGIIFYPKGNHAEIDQALNAQAIRRNITLSPVERLDQAVEQLGITIRQVYLESPYRGLEAFRAEDRKIYFGRQREIIELKNKLLAREAEKKPGLLIIAASGAGKTSLVQAGLLPTLQSGYQALEDRPLAYQVWQPSDIGATITETALIHSLYANWQTLPEINAWLTNPPPTLAALAQQLKSHWPQEKRLLWVINQMEELFTLDFSQELLKTFGEFLLTLQQQGVWLIATLRSDFYDRYQAQAPLLQLFGSAGSYDLPPLDEAALRQIIEEPARLAGVQFEIDKQGISLVDRLFTDMRGNTDALPLLEFVLQGLYQQKSTDGIMSYASYDQLGGLLGAIGQQAEQVFAELSAGEQDSLTRLLWKIVAQDNTNQKFVAQSIYLREFNKEDPIRSLINVFVINRLLIQDNDNFSGLKIKVAHEALLSHWPRAYETIVNFIYDIRLQDQLQHQAQDWIQSDKSKIFLISQDQVLRRAEILLFNRKEFLPNEVVLFIESSVDNFNLKLINNKIYFKRKIYALVSFVFIILFSSLLAWQQKIKAEVNEFKIKKHNNIENKFKELTRTIPDMLKNIPGSEKATISILENSIFLADELLDLYKDDKDSQKSKSLYMLDIGYLYFRYMGDVEKALEYYEKSHDILHEIYSEYPDDFELQKAYADSLSKQGDCYKKLNNFLDANSFFERALEIRKSNYEKFNNIQAKSDLADILNRIADFNLETGDFYKSYKMYSDSINIRKFIKDKDKDNYDNILYTAVSYKGIGDFYKGINDNGQSLEYYDKSIKCLNELIYYNKYKKAMRFFSVILNSKGDLFMESGDYKNMFLNYNKALEIRSDIYNDDVNDIQAKVDLSVSYYNIGIAYKKQKKYKLSLMYLNYSLYINNKLVSFFPKNEEYNRFLYRDYFYIGELYKEHGYINKSEFFLKKSIVVIDYIINNNDKNHTAKFFKLKALYYLFIFYKDKDKMSVVNIKDNIKFLIKKIDSNLISYKYRNDFFDIFNKIKNDKLLIFT